MDVDDLELAAVRAAFCLMAARWRLTQGELRPLLGVRDADVPAARVLPDRLDAAAETRMRLLLRLDAALGGMVVDGDVGGALRMPDPGDGGRPPLAALRDLALLRASVRVAEDRVASGPPLLALVAG